MRQAARPALGGKQQTLKHGCKAGDDLERMQITEAVGRKVGASVKAAMSEAADRQH